ncbi:MAG TPA: gamma-glutamyltransferase [Bryobacteraceae bacterium]|jgi:gamma-glutamyltranspeptidase/glutathione hydrolase|nr:gamma-glutamyltransferase [Bryobacteraceae bacterium]
MLHKSLLCFFTACALLTAQSTPPAQQSQRARGGRTAGAASTQDANDQENGNANGGRGQTMKQLARGTLYAAASMTPQATLAAEHMLEQGGNAFDAIVAGQAVLGLTQPSLNGMGSDATLLIWDAKAQKVWSLNAEGTAPKLATIEWYKTHQGGKIPVNDTLLSGTVPGVMDAWYIMLSKWGTKRFADVLAPAIEMAERGVAIGGRGMNAAAIQKYPTSAKLFAPPSGDRWTDGEVWKNPDLAHTWRRLVEAEKQASGKGRLAGLKAARDLFYKGDIAREMAKFSEENGGLFRYEDFASYTAKLEEPVSTTYRGYTVYKNPSASQGPAELFALNILEGYDLHKMGQNSADYIHTTAEAIKLAMADRDRYLGDMDFITIPFSGLLSKDYATARRALIDPNHASLEFRPGDVSPYVTPNTKVPTYPTDVDMHGNASHDGDTSYISVVDRDRNLISFTPSLHSAFGTKVVIGNLGFIFNCRGDYYSLVEGHANALAPGKRPRSTLQGTLVMKDGKPYFVTGSPGADDQIMRTIQTLLNMIDFGMNMQQAIEAPRWSTRSFPASPFPHTMYPGDLLLESRIPESVKADLEKRGHKVTMRGPWSMNDSAGIVIDWKNGAVSAAADPRTTASGLAW